MPQHDFVELWAAEKDPTTRADLLRARFRYDVGGFLKWCWPELFGRPWNGFHREVLDLHDPPASERKRNLLRAWAAPRGIAKTTLGKGRAAHKLVYGLEDFIVVLSAEARLARSISSHLRSWFLDKGSTPFNELYGPFEVEGGKDEWAVQVGDDRKRGVLARSFGTQVRGANLDGKRPTYVIVDDGERPDRVRNPDQRAIWQTFLDDDVLQAGPTEGGLVVDWLGTVLHPDAILARLLRKPSWRGKKYQALVSWPERTDLWDRCGAIYMDLSLGNEEVRHACAKAFYEANREEMDRGAEVLDEVARPLFAFYMAIWSHGLRTVLRELQNEPRDATAQIFTSEQFARCRLVDSPEGGRAVVNANGRRVRLADCRLRGWWDPSIGDIGGDYAALGVIARDKWGYGYLIAAWMKKAPKSRQLEALWSLAELTGCTRWGVEANGFQRHLAGDFRRQRNERREQGELWQVQIDEVTTTENKDERISNLEVPVTNGWLQFAEGLPQAGLLQFDDFPNADHDDFPDMVEAVWKASGGVTPSMVKERLA